MQRTTSHPHPRSRIAYAILVSAVWLATPGAARAEQASDETPAPQAPRRLFAGSVQVNHMLLPRQSRAAGPALDGPTVEMSLKAEVEVTDRVTVSAKVCVACHGLETGRAYVELSLSDSFRLRAGRFAISFGEFPARHDPANHLTSDKPLPYDMGRMVHLREWNMSVLPAPWVDNGVEISGSVSANNTSLDIAAFAVNGPKGASTEIDFDYIESRSPARYYLDNNSQPAVGGRVAVSRAFDDTTVAAGASGFAGTFDPERRLTFIIAGLDLVVWHPRAVLRAEYLIRRTEMFVGDAETRLKFGPGSDGEFDNHFVKDGFYAEVEAPIRSVRVLGRLDGMRRAGNVLRGSALSESTSITRYTIALGWEPVERALVKASLEYVRFTDFQNELVTHLGLVAAF